MKIQEKNKVIELGILGYQFPDAVGSKPGDPNPDHDANWLTVKVEYKSDAVEESFQDACVLTWELSALAEALSEMIAGRKRGYVSDFLEPYLKFEITKAEDKFQFQVQYSCAPGTDNGKAFAATQLVSKEQLSGIFNELKQWLTVYPKR